MSIFGGNTSPGTGEINRVTASYTNEGATNILRSFINMNFLSGCPESHTQRLMQYQLFWHFYNGEHWRQNNDMFLSVNYCRAVVDKINSFLLGPKGFSLEVVNEDGGELTEDLERDAEAYINSVWRYNGGVRKQKEILQMGAVCGDVWLLLQFRPKKYTKSGNGNYLEIMCVDSRECSPEFRDGNIDDMEAFVIRKPLQDNKNNFLLEVTRITDKEIETWFQTDTAYDYNKTTRFSFKSSPHPYGFIPVVHIQNKVNAGDFYGYSDLIDIMKLNKVYNEIMQTLKEIVDYYSMPTTVVTGGTIKTITKGIGRIFSGLPAEANVFNLSLGEDLTSSMAFLALIKKGIHEVSDVPESVMGMLQAISNTSAAALQITYQPLIQQADAKSVSYSEGFKKLHMFMVKMQRENDTGLNAENRNTLFAKLPENFEDAHNVQPVWVYGLPQDRTIELQQSEAELRMAVNSKRNIMNRLGFKNVPKLIQDIKKERLDEMSLVAVGQGMIANVTGMTDGNSTGASSIEKSGLPKQNNPAVTSQ